ncbi:MAG TPA: D-alanine--D-alanine ligase family protein [Solirubrobacteraceae bacterium]|jgi:D-alanine-D-alanine ligase
MPSTFSPSPHPLKVAVLAGGRSSEHDVSLASAAAVREGLQAGGHEVLWVEIDRAGAWWWQGERLTVVPGAGLLEADVAFPVLHGPFGEDGVTQGLLEVLDVPYVGAGVAASAVCMDKVLFKGLMASAGVPQVPYMGVHDRHWRQSPTEVLAALEKLGLPVFVKPAHLGSSVGIVKVSEPEGMGQALQEALAHDELAIVEAMASGLEVECGVLGQSQADDEAAGAAALASEPGEIVLPGASEWYDFEAKYKQGGMELVVPARISAGARERVRRLAVDTFVHAGCEGLARVDFFVDGEEVLVNELNTMPGFTPTSVYAKLLDASGVSYPELVERLCRLGMERHAARRIYSY